MGSNKLNAFLKVLLNGNQGHLHSQADFTSLFIAREAGWALEQI
jgi:hypothetical protein